MHDETQAQAAAAVQALLAGDMASQSLGMSLLAAGSGHAEVAMLVRPDMANGHRICHGGLIFALADSAFAFASNSHGAMAVAAGATIEFLRPARVGERLVAIAHERSRGRRSGLYDVTVQRDDGKVVAVFRGRSHHDAAG